MLKWIFLSFKNTGRKPPDLHWIPCSIIGGPKLFIGDLQIFIRDPQFKKLKVSNYNLEGPDEEIRLSNIMPSS